MIHFFVGVATGLGCAVLGYLWGSYQRRNYGRTKEDLLYLIGRNAKSIRQLLGLDRQ